MASPQPENGFTRLSNELFEQIIMRPFSKRQRAILDLLIRLSYGCGRKSAYIPKLSDFIVCGIDKHHIKPELIQLEQMNVIGWNKGKQEFRVVKDYDRWAIPHPDADRLERMHSLVGLNLNGYQNSNQENEESYRNGNQEVTKTVTLELPKGQLEGSKNLHGSKGREVPKENIKEKVKEIIIMPDFELTLDERQALELLYQIFDPRSADNQWIRNISTQYPQVHLSNTALSLITWLDGRPREREKKNANHRMRFLNFVKTEAKSNPRAEKTSSPDDSFLDAARRLEEQIEQQRRRAAASSDTHREAVLN